MKIRCAAVALVLIALFGGLAFGLGRSKPVHAIPNSVLRSSAASPLLRAARPHPIAALPQGVPPSTGPSPVNLLTAGVYQNSPHPNNSGLADVAFGDFNGDGKQDMVTVDGSACISVLPGDGKGHFSGTPIDSCIFPVRSIYYVVAGDFNNDGILDVAVVSDSCCNPNNIYVMWAQGNGDGTFTYVSASTVTYSWAGGQGQLGYGEQPRSLIAADLNGDGNLDLVMTTSGGGPNNDATYVFLGNGKFGFTPSLSSLFGGCSASNGAVVADFNHDGIPDLAVTNSACGVQEVEIMIGNGDGTFQPVASNGRYPMSAGGANYIAAGDFNSDGNVDLVVVGGAGGNPITAFLGNGDGTFGKAIYSTTVYNPDYLAVGDFNGDGKDDVIVSSDYSGGYADGVQFSNGDGHFAAPGTPGFVQYDVLSSPTRVFVTDLNGDGHADWVSISNGSEFFCVALGSGTGGFLAATVNYTTPGNFGSGTTQAIAADDFNQDGNLDYAVVGSDRNYAGLDVAIGDGSGNFAPPVHYNVGNPTGLVTGLFNNDKYPDIAVIDQSNKTVSVLLNNGDGTFANPVSYAVGTGGGYIQAADFNGDGKTDLIVTNSGDGAVSVLLGNGDGTFQAQEVSTAQTGGSYLTVADFNGDGIPDVAVTSYGSQTISILLGLPNASDPTGVPGTFQAPMSFSSNLQIACGIAAGDFNKDGKIDLAVCAQLINNRTGGDGGVAIFLGNGDGSFQAGVNYPTVPVGLNGNPVTFGIPRVGDLNNDGNLDIVIPNDYAYTDGVNLGPAILLGKGDGTFTLNPAPAALTGANEIDVALGDFNNDGLQDVAVLNDDPFNGALNLNAVTMLLSTSGTSVVLQSSQNPSTEGQSVTFTATVETSLIGLPTPTGTITFELGATEVPVTLVNGVATYTTSALPVGNTAVFAAYSGDTNFIPSTSLAVLQVVKPAPLAITTTTLPDAVQNVSYSGSVMADGGIPSYSFTLINNTSLPAGLTLSGNGTISGTPTGLPGTSSFTVQVQDSENPVMTATASLSILVASNLKITTTSLPNGGAGDSYSASIIPSGGTPSYTFSITGGTSLPAGLVLNSGTGAISGTPLGPAGTSSFTVQVQDSATPAQTASASLSITVSSGLTITTTSLPNGVQNASYTASVAATGGVGPYSFSTISGAPPSGITMNSSGAFSGSSSVVGTASFTVQAKDSSTPAQTATATLSITIAGNLAITTTSLPNGVVNDSYSQTVVVSGGNPPYTLSLINGTSLPNGLTLNATTGAITGTPSTTGTTNFTVQVKDSSTTPQTATANLSITVTGPLAITTTSLPNGVQNVSYSASVSAAGGVGPYSFTITSGAPPSGITMSSSGVFSGSSSVVGTASFTVQAKDSSTPAQTATATLSITIAGNLAITTTSLLNGVVNDSYSQTVAASGGIPSYTFSITGGSLPTGLTLNGSTGVVSGTPTSAGTSSFTVQVKDSSSPANTATANLSITVTGALQITTTSLINGVQGSTYSANVTAAGGVPAYTFTITSGSLPAGLTPNSGTGAISGTPSAVGTSSFTVQAKDSSTPPETATANLSITITNNLTITTTSLPGGVAGSTYSATITAGGGNPPYTFSDVGGFLPGGLSLSSSGALSGTPSSSGVANFTVQVTDSSTPVQKATASFSFTISGTLTIGTLALPSGVVGDAYNATVVAAGGNPSYTFSRTGGTLPAGLSLSSSGAISGTPSAAGTSSFDVQVTDSSNPAQKATAKLSITVVGPLEIVTTSLPPVNFGSGIFGAFPVLYSTVVKAQGGIQPYTWSCIDGCNLPPGLTLPGPFLTPIGSGTTSIGGDVPPGTAAGTYTFEVQISDSVGDTTTAQLSITVTQGLAITTTSLPAGTVGVPYNATISAANGTAPYTFSIINSLIPPGLSMNAGGVISGTPTFASTYGFPPISVLTVQVQDSSNPAKKATAYLSITISQPVPLSITTFGLPGGSVGNSYSASVAATGGTAPYTFTTISGSLPASLTLNRNTGVISGKPSTVGTSSFTVQVKDSSSPAQIVTASLSITISPKPIPLAITTTTLPNGAVGNSYGAGVLATGGNPPYIFTTISGSLPAGLTLDSFFGQIAGTPSVTGTSSFTVQVQDSSSPVQTASATLSITISPKPPPLAITTTKLPNGLAGNPYNASVVASGGNAPYTFWIAVGSLPAGLTLNGSTGVVSGNPSVAGTSSFTVQAQDSSSPIQTASATLSITIVPTKLAISKTPLPNGVVGGSYNASVTVTGGTAPYTFSIIGSLPPGLDNASGQILGIPGAAGTSAFTVQVQDSGSPAQTASASLSITIYSALAITTTSLPGVVVGTPYNVRVTAVGGVPPLTFSATGLPSGLSMNSAGLITGISSTVGTSLFVEVAVTDSSSPTFPDTAFADLSITTYNKLALPATKLEPGYTGYDYDTANPSALIPVTGGVPPYTFSLIGSLPAGLTLNSGGGIVGTPSSPGTSNFTVQVTDSASPQEKASENLSLKIVLTMVVTQGTLHDGTIGVPYSAKLGVTGGTPPYKCSLPSGIVYGGSGGTVVIGGGGPAPTNSLPPGLVLLPDGTVEGTPTGPAGTYNAVIEVQDSGNPTQTVDFAITWNVQ